ncbi:MULTISPECIES: MarR family winged helix-turn-helix transcriptional regulator [Weeksellaceae]|uniref:MarR family winged helix-turn-helix transcriptional regulator n=1 Tax=Weeksellaceae TaxID=2762318 RepID=UPI001F0A25E2|nr:MULTISPECIES: MarR family transcriptional regulator [Weeksellaceae]MDV3462924.1 MarR family transcriptional regulator [Elizabethkingia anophelis]UMQ41726.1 MarR family transcriptional regulator [Chryseobacterium sp. Y16C]WQM38097.1 MarR family transcriptional regulator [Elizabethkingia miricola]
MSKEIDFHFKSPKNSPGYLLGQVTMLWQRKIKKCLDPLDLTQTQFVLLAALGWLSKTNNSVTQVDIANQSNTDRMMVSKVLRTLEEKGFLTRQEHKTDTRAKTIQLTDSGAEVLQKALMEVENTDLEFFSILEDEVSYFNKYMSVLIEEHNK